MPLFEAISVDKDYVAKTLSQHWSLDLGNVIKESINHTFTATASDGEKFAVRVCLASRLDRVKDEVLFVNYLSEHGVEGVCDFVPTKDGAFFVAGNGLIVLVMNWAKGEIVDFFKYAWLLDDELIFSWGAWVGRMHNASREFSKAHPDVAARIQNWEDNHSSIMKGCPIDPADAIQWPHEDLGVLHGDVNISNFHYSADKKLYVFDWDQIQRGWWESDVAHACLTAFMLNEAGAVVSGEKVPQAEHPEKFVDKFVEGYNSTCARKLDRARLDRMILIRKKFYARFAEKALREERETAPPGMMVFIEFTHKWANRYL
eukprot:jgi/Mesvir1/7045/Mv09161-RA.1